MPSKSQIERKVADRVQRYGACAVCGGDACKHLAKKAARQLASRKTEN
jgi:hypothetical protein